MRILTFRGLDRRYPLRRRHHQWSHRSRIVRRFCRDIEVIQVERGHQMLNFVETAVRLSKKIIASVFKNRSLKSLPNLTMQEVLSLISAVRDISNTKPIHGKSTNITPNHFLKNNWVIGAQNQSAIIAGDLQTAFNQLAINTGLAQNNLGQRQVQRRGRHPLFGRQ